MLDLLIISNRRTFFKIILCRALETITIHWNSIYSLVRRHCKYCVTFMENHEFQQKKILVQVPAIETCFMTIDEIARIFSTS